MTFDDLQHEWQSQTPNAELTINADQLLQEVRRNYRTLQSSLLQRDLVEIAAAAIAASVFGYGAVRQRDWSLFLCTAGVVFVGVFFVVDRWRQRRRRPVLDETLQACLQASLDQINHQIWLLKNIFWWYLLPLSIGVFAMFATMGWNARHEGVWSLLLLASVVSVCGLFFGFVYWLNQVAVKNTLEPRRAELESLITHLKE